ncbi:uncharacterized protein LOC126739056 isoform X1 [Anthonomus grandis grandis]|uniref:uncharacterized protein LOC126739056 isoform X1 n=1 Tax=Anthonomus grandis grandis TaxID=2921223 RepID=UPI002166369F|nr:uncharacterized protein LOC126739056 isoform X1 [Anthonomus grandis grandis]XP_050300535.1 uncharacterized protein LOC126739056 isoform X1 [Anthonomus grandis grandis]
MNMQKQRRELGIKRFWSAVKNSNSSSSQGDHDSPPEDSKSALNCSLPLLQVWPSSDSPRGEADGQSFVFPECSDGDNISQHSTCLDTIHHTDSGIESSQVSPLPPPVATSPIPSPTPSLRRPSTSLLHPDHARLFRLYQVPSPDQTSMEDVSDQQNNLATSLSSSTTSSLTSIAAGVITCNSIASNSSDSRRRSSSMTTRYSLFDALDLEYALLRAAARGSVGPYSLSESLHKLTFTQSLAFPALARGLAGKRRRSHQNSSTRPLDTGDSGLNAFAKVVTVLVLVLVSVLVFAVVYKFVRT